MLFLEKIIHILSKIIYVGIAIYAIACIPNLFGCKPLIILTGSMQPTYKIGSIIYYEKINKEDIKVGDVLTFKINNKTLVTHRVVAIENDVYTTKGDANNTEDPKKIEYEDVEGKAKEISIPYLGYYIQWINKNLYIVAIAVVILLLEFAIGGAKIINTSIIDDEII